MYVCVAYRWILGSHVPIACELVESVFPAPHVFGGILNLPVLFLLHPDFRLFCLCRRMVTFPRRRHMKLFGWGLNGFIPFCDIL